jgi:hypothetical protein
MTTVAPAAMPARSPSAARRVGRFQGALVIAGLLAAVAATVALVATPASSSATGANAAATAPATLPAGLRVAVQGGEPFVAYGVADRLASAGASLGAVSPAADARSVEPTTAIVYYDRRQLATATRIRSMLGRGTLRRQQVFQPEVDVTIVLGKDLSRL